MTAYIKELTGENHTGGLFNAGQTDLGIMRWDSSRGCIVAMFGDTNPFGDFAKWKSPVIMCYNRNMEMIGVPNVSPAGSPEIVAAPVRQLWPYPHNNPEFSTVLPTDFIKVGNWWYVSVMVTKGLGNERWVEFQRSTDLVHWEHTKKYIWCKDHPDQVMLTYDQIEDWIYIFSTGGLRRDMPIYLRRCHSSTFPHGDWQGWSYTLQDGWGWGYARSDAVRLGRYGELCFRYYPDEDTCLLTFFDAENYRVSAMEFDRPTDNLTGLETEIIETGRKLPQLYGGYQTPHPLNEVKVAVSQWNTATNDPYRVLLYELGGSKSIGCAPGSDRQDTRV